MTEVRVRPRPEVLLSFDVEEFDAPLEYGGWIPETEQDAVSVAGLRLVLALLAELGIRTTLFCTASFAERQAGLIREAAHRHEIASPGSSASWAVRFGAFALPGWRPCRRAISGLPATRTTRPSTRPGCRAGTTACGRRAGRC